MKNTLLGFVLSITLFGGEYVWGVEKKEKTPDPSGLPHERREQGVG